MTKLLKIAGLATLATLIATPQAPAFTTADITQPAASDLVKHLPRQFNAGKPISLQNPGQSQRRAVVTDADCLIGPTSSYGTIEGPDGLEWSYTAKYKYTSTGSYKSAAITIYNAQNEIVGTINDTFELAENDTGVNMMVMNPNVTQHFFNTDDRYEVMLYIHATTVDYSGHNYQHVFAIAPDQTKPLAVIEGNQIQVDKFEDGTTRMVMLRDLTDAEDSYFMCYDIYENANEESPDAPRFVHTFNIDYRYVSGMGEAAWPIIQKEINGKPVYVIPHYEKPFFDDSIPVWVEPVVNPDNFFVIDFYDGTALSDDCTPYHSVKLPVTCDEGYLFTFPCIGSLLGSDDVSEGFFPDSDEPLIVVAHENYVTANDDFRINFYLYDMQGNKVRTLLEGADGYMQLCPIEGQETQLCYYNFDEGGYHFIDLPSGRERAFIPFAYEDYTLSTSLDRVATTDGSYEYIFAVTTGDVDPMGNVVQNMACFDPEGKFKHWESIAMGSRVEMAQVAVIGEWLNPYLYDDDPARDYMILAKVRTESDAQTSRLEEHFLVRSITGKELLDFGPDKTKGGELSSVSLLNPASDAAQLMIVYNDWYFDTYTLNMVALPLKESGVQLPTTDVSAQDLQLYHLNGTRVQGTPAPGLYLTRGRKVLIK